MMKVEMADEKFHCMIFKYLFDHKLKELMDGLTTLINACEEVQKSVRLRKLMALILMLGNQINTGGSGNMAHGFTLDALLKLDEVSVFTSVGLWSGMLSHFVSNMNCDHVCSAIFTGKGF